MESAAASLHVLPATTAMHVKRRFHDLPWTATTAKSAGFEHNAASSEEGRAGRVGGEKGRGVGRHSPGAHVVILTAHTGGQMPGAVPGEAHTPRSVPDRVTPLHVTHIQHTTVIHIQTASDTVPQKHSVATITGQAPVR